MDEQTEKAHIANYVLDDLYTWNKWVMGFSDMQSHPHKALCQFIEEPERENPFDLLKFLILLPLGTFKSSLITVGRTCQQIAKNRNIRILIDSEERAKAKKFLKDIKEHLESNPTLLTLFPQGFKKEPGWTEEHITVKGKTRPSIEATVTTSGIDYPATQEHFDLIISDDPVSQKTVKTLDQIEKSIEHFKLIMTRLWHGGTFILVGHRWDLKDVYSYVIREHKHDFFFLIRKAIEDDGELYFPQLLSKEKLALEKRNLGAYAFSCLFQNDPVDQEAAEFKKSWIQYYEELPGHVNFYITCDSASGSPDPKTDESAVVTTAVDENWNLYVEQVRHGRAWNPRERFNQVRAAHLMFPETIKVGIEKDLLGGVLIFQLEEARQRGELHFRATELPPGGRSKEIRIRRLIPKFENGQVFLKGVRDKYGNWHLDKGMEALEYQILRFPRAEFIDILDAFAYVLDLIPGPARRPKKVKKRVIASRTTGY